MNILMRKTLPLVVKAQAFKAARQAKKGQGVIEYAGALVIAAALVAAVLTIGPTNIATLFTDIMTKVSTYMTGKLPS
jgi:hypothetical protein